MRLVSRALILLAVSTAPMPAGGQTLVQPTPAPAVTAESEPWFVSREPLFFAGTLYFPAGPQVHFNRNEMVSVGSYGAVSVYVRTTLEPRSVIFVPLTGGLMQPYERRRSGELAGTEGSTPPSFPVANAAEPGSVEPRTPPAAGPPVGPPVPARPVGTTGTTAVIPTRPFASASRPQGLNGVFVNYSSRRWFNSGEAQPFDAASFTRIGTYATLPVYSRSNMPGTIFIPVSAQASALVVPYSTTRGR